MVLLSKKTPRSGSHESDVKRYTNISLTLPNFGIEAQCLSCSRSTQGIDCFQALLFSQGTLSDYPDSKWRGRVKSIGAMHDGTLCQYAGTLWEERNPSLSRQMPKCLTRWCRIPENGMEKCKLCLLKTPTQNKTWRGLSFSTVVVLPSLGKVRQKNVHKDQWQQLQSCQPNLPKTCHE